MSEEIFYKKTEEAGVVEEFWYKIVNNEVVLHNENAPAYIRTANSDAHPGTQIVLTEYRKENELHREDGPASIWTDGEGENKEYFYEGRPANHLRLIASARGHDYDSWEDLVRFAGREDG
jgi:hypothetical protein